MKFGFWQIGQVLCDVEGGGAGAVDTDLADVIAGSISGLDSGDGDAVVEVPPPALDTKEVKADKDPTEESELASLAAEWRAKNPSARGQIAIDRHQAVLTRTRNQHQKLVEEWTAKEKAWQDAEQKYKEQVGGYGWVDSPEAQAMFQALELSEKDPKAFAQLLLQDERYAQLLALKDAQEKQAALSADMPGPNQKDGEIEYYDNDGLKSLLNWQAQTLTKSLTEQITNQVRQEMDAKYGDVAAQHQATVLWNQELQTAKSALEDMRTNWIGFTEFEKDIKAMMVKNLEDRKANPHLPRIDAREAYRIIVPPKLQERSQVSEKTMREKIMKELEAKRHAAGGAVRASAPERSSESGGSSDPIGDAIRNSLPRE